MENQDLQTPNNKEEEQKTTNSLSENAKTVDPKEEKKKAKEEKRKQYWQMKRADERLKRKEKKRKRKELGETNPQREINKKLKKRNEKEIEFKGNIVFDCSFDSLMTEKEIASLGNQITYSYASNLKALYPMKLCLSGLKEKLAAQLDKIDGVKHWKHVQRDTKHYLELFKKEDLIYLTSESDNVLEKIEPDKSYIIGAIVDHNRLKGITFEQAKKEGIAHAQLPIGDYMNLKTRKVLTVNQVVEILLFFNETNDWAKAFDRAIPKRKGGTLKQLDDGKAEQDTEQSVVSNENVSNSN